MRPADVVDPDVGHDDLFVMGPNLSAVVQDQCRHGELQQVSEGEKMQKQRGMF
jgi:hypothetical protein